MRASSGVTRTRCRVSRNQSSTNSLTRSINTQAPAVDVRCCGRMRTYILHAAFCVFLLALPRTSHLVDAHTDIGLIGGARDRLTSGSRAAAAAQSDQIQGPGEGASLLKWFSGSIKDMDAVSSLAMAGRTLLEEEELEEGTETPSTHLGNDSGAASEEATTEAGGVSAGLARGDESASSGSGPPKAAEAADSGDGGIYDSDGSPGDGGDGGGLSGDDAAVTSRVSAAPRSLLKPPLTLEIIPSQPIAIPDKCVFILGTGRSGSTSLLDAVNQLPNYLIRGEQGGAFWYLYMSWRLLVQSAKHAYEFHTHAKQAAVRFGERPSGWLSFNTVKQVYDTYAVRKKLPWFNDMHHSRVTDAARAFYLAAYGYHGPGIVSGFKEIRFVCGRAFPSPGCNYEDFDDFLQFLRSLCTDVKVLLNSRSSAAIADNGKLGKMLVRNGVINDTAKFEADLTVTHSWYDRYVKEHPSSGFRVLMEDMFNPEKNATLARRLLKFLGESTEREISFVRMPSWSTRDGSSKHDTSKSRSRDRDPKELRRHLRRLITDVAAATTVDDGATAAAAVAALGGSVSGEEEGGDL